ncbi:MAG: four helix bundle protein [Crocinitomicaceae bacterium]|jgi:four helix bundle protein|nr:four helix bundle protein [Crocinitomicaceae bacterium]
MKHNFKELLVWKKSIDLVKSVYLLTSTLPSEEKFGLISQMNRSSVSIPSNIAEGSGRTSNKEFLYFLNIAISSSYELETQLIISNQLFLIDVDNILSQISEVQKMILGLKKNLENNLINSSN